MFIRNKIDFDVLIGGHRDYVFSHFATKGDQSSLNLTALPPMGIIGRAKNDRAARAYAASAVGLSNVDEKWAIGMDFDLWTPRNIERALPQPREVVKRIL